VLGFDELSARKTGRVNVGRVCIDSGSRTDVVEDLIIKDRRHLSEDGIVLPIIAINKLTGRVESTSPEIVTRGFAPGEDGFMAGARQIVLQTLELSRDRKSTRLNSSHVAISYAVFCLKKKKITSYYISLLSQIVAMKAKLTTTFKRFCF